MKQTKTKNLTFTNPIIDNRIVSDKTFAVRLYFFLKGVNVCDLPSEEEKDYLLRVAELLVAYQKATITSEYVDGVLMMSDTDMEKHTNEEFVRNAHGDVMIAGLGIGLILDNLEDKVRSGEIQSITVYEKYQDVIDLVYPKYKHLPLKVICQDILEYKPSKNETYDTIYFDIWPDINSDNLTEIKMLHNRWKFRKREGGWMDSWMKYYLQRNK